jgi:nucleotide-binding universal stress UspA family protein
MNAETPDAAYGTGHADQAAGILAGAADAPVYAVVGFDGTAPALRALDAAVRLLTGRDGGLEVVFVAPFPVVAADLRGLATADVIEGEDETARNLSDEVSAHLQSAHLTGAAQNWRFQRRNGGAADQLMAAAGELSQQHGPDVRVVIIVGRPEHKLHQVTGSVPRSLERHDGYPVIVIP